MHIDFSPLFSHIIKVMPVIKFTQISFISITTTLIQLSIVFLMSLRPKWSLCLYPQSSKLLLNSMYYCRFLIKKLLATLLSRPSSSTPAWNSSLISEFTWSHWDSRSACIYPTTLNTLPLFVFFLILTVMMLSHYLDFLIIYILIYNHLIYLPN